MKVQLKNRKQQKNTELDKSNSTNTVPSADDEGENKSEEPDVEVSQLPAKDINDGSMKSETNSTVQIQQTENITTIFDDDLR